MFTNVLTNQIVFDENTNKIDVIIQKIKFLKVSKFQNMNQKL